MTRLVVLRLIITFYITVIIPTDMCRSTTYFSIEKIYSIVICISCSLETCLIFNLVPYYHIKGVYILKNAHEKITSQNSIELFLFDPEICSLAPRASSLK